MKLDPFKALAAFCLTVPVILAITSCSGGLSECKGCADWDAVAWAEDVHASGPRLEMVGHVVEHLLDTGMSADEIEEILGPGWTSDPANDGFSIDYLVAPCGTHDIIDATVLRLRFGSGDEGLVSWSFVYS